MKVVGLITEYNPFHNGHVYHIQKAKEVTGADFIVVVMSGNYVQRGTPAIIDKYSRTKMALLGGADLVLELPLPYATSSAEDFAMGAITLLDKLGVVDYVCFGSESGDTKSLYEIAKTLLEEPIEYQKLLQQYVKSGKNFPKARSLALFEYIQKYHMLNPNSGFSFLDNDKDYFLDIISAPNNILAIEYIKAIIKRNSPIKPIAIKRITTGYHDTDLSNNIASATGIREYISQFIENKHASTNNHTPASNNLDNRLSINRMPTNDILNRNYLDNSNLNRHSIENFPSDTKQTSKRKNLKNKKFSFKNINLENSKLVYEMDSEPSINVNNMNLNLKQLPSYASDILKTALFKSFPIYSNDFSSLLSYRLLSQPDLAIYLDCSNDLAKRIENHKNNFCSFEDFVDELKTKQFTRTRISRVLLHILLDIKEKDLRLYKEKDFILYSRILGFNKKSSLLLSYIKSNDDVPLISKIADAGKILSPLGNDMLTKEINSTNLYNLVIFQKFHTHARTEFQTSIVLE